MSWINPVTNRTGGCYTYEDLNRVGGDVQHLADLLNGYGYAVAVNPKTDWMEGGVPRATEAANYLADVTALKAAFYGTTPLPATMAKINYTDANNIEKLLLEIETYINRMVSTFVASGEATCGGDYI